MSESYLPPASVISSYIRRFREAPPLPPSSRVSFDDEFWWLQKPKVGEKIGRKDLPRAPQEDCEEWTTRVGEAGFSPSVSDQGKGNDALSSIDLDSYANDLLAKCENILFAYKDEASNKETATKGRPNMLRDKEPVKVEAEELYDYYRDTYVEEAPIFVERGRQPNGSQLDSSHNTQLSSLGTRTSGDTVFAQMVASPRDDEVDESHSIESEQQKQWDAKFVVDRDFVSPYVKDDAIQQLWTRLCLVRKRMLDLQRNSNGAN